MTHRTFSVLSATSTTFSATSGCSRCCPTFPPRWRHPRTARSRRPCTRLTARIRVGDTVVIQGLGGLGLYATALAKDSGAGCVIGVDGVRDRLTMARRFGADAVLDIREVQGPEDRNAEIAGLTDGAGADAVIEMAGVPAVVPEGLGYLRPGGRYVLVGNITAGATVEIARPDDSSQRERVVGVVTYPQWALRGQSTGSAGDRTPIPSPTWSPRATRSRRSTTRSPPPNGTASGMQAGKAVILMT